MDLLIALTPSLDIANVTLLFRAVKSQLNHTDVLLVKKAYKAISQLCTYHAAFVAANLVDLQETLESALATCPPACKGKRLVCLQALMLQLSPSQLQQLIPTLLGEVVLATRELNVKTRAAAFDLLISLAEHSRQRAKSEDGRIEAVRSVVVMVAAGLAGNTPHMMAASLAALSRLIFEHKDDCGLTLTFVQLFTTVLTLLLHRAQEVVRAAIVFIKVALSCLPTESVQPLLPQLVPPMLTWCSNKHPHLKMQVRYLIERLVKRFGYDVMAAVTPEAHQRLLIHMRKQKVRGQNHAMARREARRAAEAGVDTTHGGREERATMVGKDQQAGKKRHEEYEALAGEGAPSYEEGGGGDIDYDDDELVGSDGNHTGRRADAASMAARKPWMDGSLDAAEVDLLTAPLVGVGGGRATELRKSSGKRGREEAHAEDDRVDFDDELGKLTVKLASSDRPAEVNFAGGAVQEVDAEDEIVRPGQIKRQRGNAGEKRTKVVVASAAEVAEGAKGRDTSARDKKKKAYGENVDYFGAQMGDQFKSKKGARGDMKKPGGTDPFAYLPLNPRLLGKKQQRKAAATMGKLHGKKGKPGVLKGGRVGKHGVVAKRGRGSNKK